MARPKFNFEKRQKEIAKKKKKEQKRLAKQARKEAGPEAPIIVNRPDATVDPPSPGPETAPAEGEA